MIGIYCRVSTDDQNVEQQKQLLISSCKDNNNYRTYIDYAISGKIDQRPSWNKLLRDCEKGIIHCILVSKWDRITRDLEYAIKFLNWLKPFHKKGLELQSLYDGKFDFTPDAVFVFKLKCLLSEHELEVLRWRSRIGIDRAKREGKYKYGKGRPKPKS